MRTAFDGPDPAELLQMDIKASTLKNDLFLIFWGVFKENLPFFRGAGGVYSVVAPKTQIWTLNRGVFSRGGVSMKITVYPI